MRRVNASIKHRFGALTAAVRHRAMITTIGIVAMIIVVTAACGGAYVLRENSRRNWADEMSSLSFVLAEHATQTLSSAHALLDSLHDSVMLQHIEDEASFKSYSSQRSSFRLLEDKVSANPVIDVATFVARDGTVLNFSRSFPPPPINLSDRDYFAAHVADASLSSFTSMPVENKGNGKWVFYISRRVDNSQGEMLGLILVGVSVEVFSQFYEKVAQNLGPFSSISLYRNDFTLMTRWPLVNKMVGKQNRAGSTYDVIGKAGKSHGVIFTATPNVYESATAMPRIAAPRTTDRYPFIVTPMVTEEHYLHDWRIARWWIFAVTIAILLLLFVGMNWLQRAYSRAENELAERRLAQTAMRKTQEQLESRVQERTRTLTMEVAERQAAQLELRRVNEHIADVSHKAGMAEVANSVLHNVGNVLNSINVSVTLLAEQIKTTPLVDFPAAVALLQGHGDGLGRYLTEDAQGRQLPGFLDLLAQHWQKEHAMMSSEAEQLSGSVQHVKDIISRQQSLSGHSGLYGQLNIKDLLDDVLTIHGTALRRMNVQSTLDLNGPQVWIGDKSKLTQILINLGKNAEESLSVSAAKHPAIEICSTIGTDNRLEITVKDNGCGISPDALKRLFTYGFTTKPTGHGFGLHASALAAREMHGSLHAESDGEGFGATFILSLPQASPDSKGQI